MEEVINIPPAIDHYSTRQIAVTTCIKSEQLLLFASSSCHAKRCNFFLYNQAVTAVFSITVLGTVSSSLLRHARYSALNQCVYEVNNVDIALQMTRWWWRRKGPMLFTPKQYKKHITTVLGLSCVCLTHLRSSCNYFATTSRQFGDCWSEPFYVYTLTLECIAIISEIYALGNECINKHGCVEKDAKTVKEC